jgi:uncharacterized protein DUF3300
LTRWAYLLAVPLAWGPVAPPVAFAQQAPPQQAQAATSTYTQAELEQILAPIALYPDDLLTQVLVASTYPLEVVMASRWIDQPANKDLKGDALVKALDGQDWDASVKSLVPFPVVLKMMGDQLDWTQKLGDAFLAQQSDVFAAVQTLRGRAQAAGTLKSNTQQTVTQDASAIVIAPTQADTVYVPAYNPTVAYGAWPYPSYPPVYYPPPAGYYLGSALLTGLAFGTGIAVTSALWGWGRPNWGNGSVNVNVNRFNSINANSVNANRISNRSVNSSTWQHNADHRRGVGYTNPQVRQQYRPNSSSNAAARDAFRGRGTTGTSALGQAGQRPAGTGNLQGKLPTGGGSGNLQGKLPSGAGGAGNLHGKLPNGGSSGAGNLQGKLPNGGNGGAGNLQGKVANASRPNAGAAQGKLHNVQRPAGGGGGAPAFKGVGNGAATRAQSAQGHASRGGMAAAGGRGGGGRAGGGGGGRAGAAAARGGRR